MDRTTYTLHEYRLRYPDSAEFPTLTQSGLLAVLLERQRQKTADRERRRAVWRSIRTAPRQMWIGVWRALTVSELRHPANGSDFATRREA
jgi:hypothetical protein